MVSIIQDHSSLLQARESVQQARLRRSVKVLSYEEARQLRERIKNSAEGEVRPSYEPKQIQLRHEPVAFTHRMWLLERRQMERELEAFRKDLAGLVWQHTKLAVKLSRDVSEFVGKQASKFQNQIAEKDPATALGRLVAFFVRHRMALQVISLCLKAVFFIGLFSSLG